MKCVVRCLKTFAVVGALSHMGCSGDQTGTSSVGGEVTNGVVGVTGNPATDKPKWTIASRGEGTFEDLSNFHGVVITHSRIDNDGQRRTARVILKHILLVRDLNDQLFVKEMSGQREDGTVFEVESQVEGIPVATTSALFGAKLLFDGLDKRLTILSMELATRGDGTLYVARRELMDDDGVVWEYSAEAGDQCIETFTPICTCASLGLFGDLACSDNYWPNCAADTCRGTEPCEQGILLGCIDSGCFDPPNSFKQCWAHTGLVRCLCRFWPVFPSHRKIHFEDPHKR